MAIGTIRFNDLKRPIGCDRQLSAKFEFCISLGISFLKASISLIALSPAAICKTAIATARTAQIKFTSPESDTVSPMIIIK